MRQIGLLPSGCQVPTQNNILYYSDQWIIYASSLAVYVLNSKTFQVEKILSCMQRAIVSFSISPLNKDLIAISSSDGNIACWRISDEQIICKGSLSYSVSIAWDPFNTNSCAILSHTNIRLLLWDISTGGMVEVFYVRTDSVKPVIMRWNPSVQGLIAIGTSNGTTFLFNTLKKSHKSLQITDEKKPSVVDMQWDRLSVSYLLVAYETHLLLWDTETAEIIMNFEKQPLGISAISWMDWAAGNFITTNTRNSHIKIWNASQKTSIRSAKVPHTSSITAISLNSSKKKALIGFHDGTVLVYDLETSRVDYQSQPGHTETIFCCKINPANPEQFATASYDGTIKIWDFTNLTLVRTLFGTGEFIYCVDWSKSGRLIGGSNYSGIMMIWNPVTGRELLRLSHHNKSSYFLAFNLFDENILLSTSADNSAVIVELNLDALFDSEIQNISLHSQVHKRGDKYQQNDLKLENYAVIKYKFAHPAAIYGCAWNPDYSSIFVTCCHDGLCRIFNYKAKTLISAVLTGHTGRVFSCVWSPLVKGLLATGGDDNSILIWNIDIQKVQNDLYQKTLNIEPTNKLIGHKSFVRALNFNYENKNLLFSGSWDFSIKIWDVISGDCLLEIRDHVADVYSLVSHPLKPFTYLSCSRDTTIRVWELDNVFRIIRYYSIWDGHFDRVIQDELHELPNNILHPNDSKKMNNHNNEGNENKVDEGSPPYPNERAKSFQKPFLSLEETMHEFSMMPTSRSSFTSKLSLSLQGKTSLLLNEELEEIVRYIQEYQNLLFPKSTLTNANSSSFEDISKISDSYDSKNDMKTPDRPIKNHTNSKLLKKKSSIPFSRDYALLLALNYYRIYSFYNSWNGSMDLLEVLLQYIDRFYPALLSRANSNGNNNSNPNNLPPKGRNNNANNFQIPLPPKLSAQLLEISTVIRPVEKRKTFYENEIINYTSSENLKLVSKKDSISLNNLAQREELIELLSYNYFKNHEFMKSIQLLTENNQWELAISLAPVISIEYWKKLSLQYGEYLCFQNNSEKGIYYFLSCGAYDLAIQYYLKNHDFLSAKLIAEMITDSNQPYSVIHLFNKDINSSISNNNNNNNNNNSGMIRSVPSTRPSSSSSQTNPRDFGSLIYDNNNNNDSLLPLPSSFSSAGGSDLLFALQEKKKKYLKTIVTKSTVQQFLTQGQCILAATELLGNNDCIGCMDLLMKSGEIDLAYCIANTLNYSAWKEKILIHWANISASYLEIDFAIHLLQALPSSSSISSSSSSSSPTKQEIEITLLLAKHCNETRMRKILSNYNYKPLTYYANLLKDNDDNGNSNNNNSLFNNPDQQVTILLYYILSRQYQKATQFSNLMMKKFIREPWDLLLSTTTTNSSIAGIGGRNPNLTPLGFRSPVSTRPNSATSIKDDPFEHPSSDDHNNTNYNNNSNDPVTMDEDLLVIDNFPHHQQVIQLCKYIRLKEVNDETLKTSFLSNFLWYTAHESILHGLFHNAVYLLHILLKGSESLLFSLSKEEILIQQFFFLLFTKDYELIWQTIKTSFLPWKTTSLNTNNSSQYNLFNENIAIKESILKIISLIIGPLDQLTNANQLKIIPIAGKGWNIWCEYASGQQLSHDGQDMINMIIREMKSLSSVLGLPSIFHLHQINNKSSTSSSSNPGGGKTPASSGKLSSSLASQSIPSNLIISTIQASSDYEFLQQLLSIPEPVVLGSTLPVANQQLKSFTSYVSKRLIQGNAIPLNNDDDYVSINEAMQWQYINPFSPLLDGNFIFV